MFSIIWKDFDHGSLIVILVTFVLFVVAIFTRGFAHEILLESAVFLVSVKLIIMAYKNSSTSQSIKKSLDEIYAILRRIED